MNLRVPLFALAFAAAAVQAAQPVPVAPAPVAPAVFWPWPVAPVSQTTPVAPRTPEEWLTRMTDFTQNGSAFKDPRVFVPWSQAVTEPGFYIAGAKGAMEPGGWLNMMNSMATPAAVQNYMAFADPNMYMRWMQAGMDPAFYTAMLTQFSDPGKMMRWAMMPMDPRVWDMMFSTMNPNTYMRWGMAAMDPRTWNFMGTVMNPALYTGMAGAMMNPAGTGATPNSWFGWRPATVAGASSPWGADPVASFNMFSPELFSNLTGFLPKVGSPAPVVAQAAPAAPVVVKPAAPETKIVLSGDTLFRSGKSGIKDLSKEGKKRLDEVAAKLKSLGVIEQIRIVGHADITGKPAANQKLSERRAKAVKSYLVAKGVKPNVIITSGVGDTQPVVQCDPKLAKKELVACLEPNRRVEIEIVGKAK
ncbi:OmpA family protein [Parasulfuritortus cantonensis]|uniref:OmpA family protein n=1 Tax=Parasulfuritortus cantonensis TaxID=2528202 RepID=A0A4R1B6S2_9PROT|nr:OmpA family protein [Parasulfuritortus cantonensis]TCJ13450.1 OmpA family protein [Parasulfuritortus cantonensis]